MDRFDAMRAFVQVVDAGSVTHAARLLDLHKATVSQQVQQLEDKLGVRLLTRTTRSIAPTAEGLAYYAQACAILQQVDEAEAMLRKGASAPAGHLRVNVPVAMGRLVFAPELRAFLERYPRLSLELGCSDRAVDLVREGVDVALRGGDLPDSRLSARPVGALRFVLCAAPHYVERHGLPGSPADLARHRQVGYLLASTGRLRPVVLERDGQVVEHELPARFVTTDSAAALGAGLDGLGLTVLAEFVAAHHLASGALVPVLPGWRCPSLPLHLVTPGARRRAARVQVFMDWAQALLRRRLAPHMELL
ncbi:MAG: LysR family transcriptional regulator [Burkholderiales bacterium]|nr:LysR family transcriptional regulator [Burkholderiales bacterium]